jgi:hypothetical protein
MVNCWVAVHAVALGLVVAVGDFDDLDDEVGVVHLDVQLDKIY